MSLKIMDFFSITTQVEEYHWKTYYNVYNYIYVMFYILISAFCPKCIFKCIYCFDSFNI